MPERYPYIGATYLLLIRDSNILLLRRSNTGFADGYYGVPAGHMEGNETARQACARECYEEAGLGIKPEDLEVVHVMHRISRQSKRERIDFFMTARAYTGEPENREPDKHDDLRWFPLNALPDNMVDYVRAGLEAYQRGEVYSEFGWEVDGSSPQ